MFRRSRYGYPPQDRLSFSSFLEMVIVILLIALFIAAFVFIYKLIGFKAMAIISGVLTSILLLVAIDDSKSPIVEIGKVILLIVFFIFALVFMYKMTGFWVIGILFGIFALFSPMFLSEAAPVTKEPDMFLDPVYKGLSGNIYTKKD
jgi:hypothetical protein